jgi:hypothetical protein
MMLIDYQIEWFLALVPLSSPENRGAFAAAANDCDPVDDLHRKSVREIERKPEHFMPPFLQSRKVTLGDPLGAAGERISRITPVEHQESHCLANCHHSIELIGIAAMRKTRRVDITSKVGWRKFF